MAVSLKTSQSRLNPGQLGSRPDKTPNFKTLSDQFNKYRKTLNDIYRNPKGINRDKIRELAKINGSTFSGKVFEYIDKAARLGINSTDFAGAASETASALGYLGSILNAGWGLSLSLGMRAIQKLAQSGSGLRNFLDHDLRGVSKKVNLAGVDFGSTGMLDYAQFDLASLDGSDFRNSKLDGVEFVGTSLKNSKLNFADLSGAVIKSVLVGDKEITTNFSGADLSDATMRSTSFSCADFVKTNLSRVLAQGSDFSGACLDGAILKNADLRAVKLHGSSLKSVDLTTASLAGAQINEQTILEGSKLTNSQIKQLGLDEASAKARGVQVVADNPTLIKEQQKTIADTAAKNKPKIKATEVLKDKAKTIQEVAAELTEGLTKENPTTIQAIAKDQEQIPILSKVEGLHKAKQAQEKAKTDSQNNKEQGTSNSLINQIGNFIGQVISLVGKGIKSVFSMFSGK